MEVENLIISHCFSRTRKKKANVFFEGLSIFHFIVLLVIFGIIGITMFTDLNTDFQADPDNSAGSKQLVQTAFNEYPSMWDDIMVMAFIGMWLFALISAFFIDTSPLFFILAVVLLVILLIFIVYMANGTYDIFTDADFEPYYSQFPKTNFLFENILVVIVIVGASIMLSLYARPRQ